MNQGCEMENRDASAIWNGILLAIVMFALLIVSLVLGVRLLPRLPLLGIFLLLAFPVFIVALGVVIARFGVVKNVQEYMGKRRGSRRFRGSEFDDSAGDGRVVPGDDLPLA